MATAIQDSAELQELADLCEQNGIYLPGDIKTVEELVRFLLIAHKTKAATLALQRERANRKRLANQRQRDGNPDSPDDGDDEREAERRVATQFSAASDVPTVARQIVDAQERYMGNPNRFKNPFGA